MGGGSRSLSFEGGHHHLLVVIVGSGWLLLLVGRGVMVSFQVVIHGQ